MDENGERVSIEIDDKDLEIFDKDDDDSDDEDESEFLYDIYLNIILGKSTKRRFRRNKKK